ncbi:MAG TPA: hypothetical protein VFH90_01940 [Candidatus Limnocylindria bacterium]|nr:hypothetical protein [Candidatus Limnocylindria bacterium]
MTGTTVPIAPIPLARSSRRLLAGPLILIAAGGAAVAGGVVLGDAMGIVLVAAGIVVAALSLYLAVMLATVRLDVEVATLRVRWLGGERRYTLVRGPVTRVPLRGPDAARLRPRFGALGWGLGRAKLRRDERIELVRLAPSATMILVPTDRGRVGIAPSSEQQLLGALAAAARIQQRLDEVAERARPFVVPAPSERAAMPIGPTPDAQPVEAVPAGPTSQRMLTGIERTLIEERLAMERAANLRAAEAERQAATDAASMATFMGAEAAAAPPAARPSRLRRRGEWHRPAWMSFGRGRVASPVIDAAATQAAAAAVEAPAHPPFVAPAPAPAPAPAVGRREEAVAVPPLIAPRRPFPIPAERLFAYGIAVTPALAAGIVWAAAFIGGRLDLPTEELRPMAVALLATGPAGALAGLIARTWFPRLLGLVAITSLVALALIGRALMP